MAMCMFAAKMKDFRKRAIVILVLAVLVVPPGAATEEDTEARQRQLAVLQKLMPLPPDAPRTIKSPYHGELAWKLWAVDPDPVTIEKPNFKGTFRPPPAGGRKYPKMGLKKGAAAIVFEPLGNSSAAGFWDDCYMSLDYHHTRLRRPQNQFIDAGKMRTARDVETLLKLGVNFTSQSYADRGRAIVDDMFNNLNTERHFFFANCIRATPAHASYRDTEQDAVTDMYDGLFAHSYQSVGQSGSEVHALYKMMLAGARMPRSTKNLLKKHGAYAIALLTIFKAALPYVDSEGRELPFEHELRHRPAYSSDGDPRHAHYCPANAYYHGYDEKCHLASMLKMAAELEYAPPVTVLEMKNFVIEEDGGFITDRTKLAQRIKCISLTNVRLWGGEGETLVAQIDLNRSYDLQDEPLTFECRPVYPNHDNVSIVEEAPGRYLIRVRHNPQLPKGRIPVIFTSYNKHELPGNPAFVNFYWPDENEADDYFPKASLPPDIRRKYDALGLKQLPVNVNRRPQVDLELAADAVHCRPGQKVAIDLKSRDPEGFPVSIYRRPGEIGQIRENRFIARIGASDAQSIYKLHLIFSDGTGGYASKRIKLLVDNAQSSLPEGWGLTTIGTAEHIPDINCVDETFTLGKQRIEPGVGPLEGAFLVKPVSKSADVVCRMSDVSAGADLSLALSNSLDDFSRRIAIGSFQGRIQAVVKAREQSSAAAQYQWSEPNRPDHFRLVSRSGRVAAFVSGDGESWQQVMVTKMDFFERFYAGIIYRAGPWADATCQWLQPAAPGLAVFSTNPAKPDEQDRYEPPVKISLDAPSPDAILRYTLDGSEPNASSVAYDKPITLTKPGRHEIRVRVFTDDLTGKTAEAIYEVKPPAPSRR